MTPPLPAHPGGLDQERLLSVWETVQEKGQIALTRAERPEELAAHPAHPPLLQGCQAHREEWKRAWGHGLPAGSVPEARLLCGAWGVTSRERLASPALWPWAQRATLKAASTV